MLDVQQAVSADGTLIAGRIHGQGPPLVLLPGRLDDGDSAWTRLLPFLTERFTCYTPSTRGRGLSEDSPDHSPARLVEDIVAFVESIGRPAGMAGWSAGGGLALAAAARSSAVAAVAVYEASVSEVLGEQDATRMQAGMKRMLALADEGDLVNAARTFVEQAANDEEMEAMSEDLLETMSRYVPLALTEFQQTHLDRSNAQRPPTDPSLLAQISAPVLVLHGDQTAQSWMTDGARYIYEHVPDGYSRVVTSVGHFGPILKPEPIAHELALFFERQLRAA